MHVLVTGAAGMIGRKLVDRLIRDGALAGRRIPAMTLVDVVAPPVGDGATCIAADLAAPGTAERLVAPRPDIIFHLAAVVSGEAEENFENGYRVNLDGSRALFDAIRAVGSGYRPRVVFTSSIAVFGGPFPEAIPDDFQPTPLTSYGAQKAMVELLLADYTRREILDGVAIRLPAITVRPGKPNRAAAGFFSTIIREPLGGREAVLPVAEDVLHTHASPRSAVGFLMHAAGLSREAIGPRIALNMPGVCCTVAEQIEALRRVGGDAAVARIRRERDPKIEAIVAGWPKRFDARRAAALGFRADEDFDEIIRVHIEDDLGGRIPA